MLPNSTATDNCSPSRLLVPHHFILPLVISVVYWKLIVVMYISIRLRQITIYIQLIGLPVIITGKKKKKKKKRRKKKNKSKFFNILILDIIAHILLACFCQAFIVILIKKKRTSLPGAGFKSPHIYLTPRASDCCTFLWHFALMEIHHKVFHLTSNVAQMFLLWSTWYGAPSLSYSPPTYNHTSTS